jgi:outer membrane lipoprotein-sorting protein
MIKKSILIILVFGALLSGCVSKGADISGTYKHTATDKYTRQQFNESITFYNDGTWSYQKPNDSNSGVYTIHDKDLVLTGQLVSQKWTINDNGTLTGTDSESWVKKT